MNDTETRTAVVGPLDQAVGHEERARTFLIEGGYSGIVYPGECGCRLDELMPCFAYERDKKTGIPLGCQPGHAHINPSGGSEWIVSIHKEPPTQEQFDRCISSI